MVTERGKIILVSLGISLFISWYLDIELIYFITAIIASMAGLSAFFFAMTTLNVSCTRKLPNASYEDDILKISLFLHNEGSFGTFFIYVSDIFPADVSYKQKKEMIFPHIGGNKTAMDHYDGFCFKRGVYYLGPLTLTVADPLGLFKKTKIMHEQTKLTVYPLVFNISNLTPYNRGVVTPRYGPQAARRSGDYEEFFGIRPYQQEDGLRKIHWPSSAKRGQLIVRHFEQTGINTATILIDLKWENNVGMGKETTLEYAIKIAASCAKYFLEHNYTVQLLAYGEKPVISTSGKDYSHLFTILELLAKTESNGHSTLTETMDKLNYLIPQTSTLVVVRLDRDFDTAKTLEKFIYEKSVSLVDIQLVTASFDNALPKTATHIMEVKGSDVVTYTINQGDNLEYKFMQT